MLFRFIILVWINVWITQTRETKTNQHLKPEVSKRLTYVMMTHRTYIYGVGLLFLYGVSLFLINLYVFEQWLPPEVIFAVTGMFGVYFLALRISMLGLIDRRFLAKVSGAAGLAIVGYTLYDVTYWMIYRGLPELGIILYNPEAEFTMMEFKANITSTFKMIVTVSAASVIWTYFRRKQESRASALNPAIIANPVACRQNDPKPILQLKVPGPARRLVKGKRSHSTVISVPSVNSRGGAIVIDTELLIHAQITDKTMTFHSVYGAESARISMDSLESLLPPEQFLRVHRSHIINIEFISVHRPNSILLHRFNDPVPVGERYKDDLKKALERLKRK